MKKTYFLISFFVFFLTIQTTFWISADQVSNNWWSTVMWLISKDAIIAIVLKLFWVVFTILWIMVFKKISTDKLINYLESKFDSNWSGWGEEVIWVITRSFNVTILIVWVSLVLGILWVDLWIFMGWIWFGIGFTLKTFLTNFTAWIVMVSQWVYHNWDLIEISDDLWKIVKINSLFTAVERLDWIIFYIPNIKFLENKVLNYHSNDKRRVDIDVLVDYNTDIIKAKIILNKVLDSFPNILNNPKPQIVIEKLDDSWILINVRSWISSSDKYMQTKSNITETINLAFRKSEIKIPYPHVEIIKTN